MNLFTEKLNQNQKFNEFLLEIRKNEGQVNLTGLFDVSKMMYLAGSIENRTICLITYNEIKAKKLIKDLSFFYNSNKICYLPKKEISTYDYLSQSTEILFDRIEKLNGIYSGKYKVVVTTIEALMQDFVNPSLLYKNILKFKNGSEYEVLNNREIKKYDMENLKNLLLELGYERADLVENEGLFSVRGGIVDVGISEKEGVRIEFWGDEVDSIRSFNLSSQRSINMLEEITIYPAHEYIIQNENIEKIAKIIESVYGYKNENVLEDLEQIRNGNHIVKIDKYYNKFYTNKATLFDYLNKNTLLFFDEMSKINHRRESIVIDNNNLIKSLIEKNRIVPEAIKNISEDTFSQKTWLDNINQKYCFKNVYMQTNEAFTCENKFEFLDREINLYKSHLENLDNDLKKWINDKKQIIFLPGSETNKNIILNYCKENNIKEDKILIYEENKDSINITSTGFENYDLNLVVISFSEFEEQKTTKSKGTSTFKQSEKIVFADLKIGDLVVHKVSGIGEYVGVNTITTGDVTKDYIKIKYDKDDMLYVPTNNLDNVRKYIGAGDKTKPKLSKLGSKDWYNAKQRVKNNLREVAKELIELYAKRKKIKGYAYSNDTTWQNQFEDNFPYNETDDQLRCIEEVKTDMQKEQPMDRLLCGDVGYGKTEVAIRAAFKAVMDQKQVAYLVPTTVLANQQFEEFSRRMSEFAINVELLNRFRTKKEQEQTIRRLKLGETDIVVGTHRLVSKDIEFKDLGLLIIDEEQRFGVKAKETIKQLKNSVDVLTMTATPIPRTLHMSIVGVRDMSVIYEPPQNRKPVQTYVVEHDEEIIKEAITKEIERDGQIFYLYNKVEGIEKKALELSSLVPEANVEFAHGQMTGKKLEDIMENFITKKTNVLVCTTILESGIDIPNANTIIVENADRLRIISIVSNTR